MTDYSRPWWLNGLVWFGSWLGLIAVLSGAWLLVQFVVYPWLLG